MTQPPIHNWSCRGRVIPLGERTLVMGILNTTPDSFSDGGAFNALDAAVKRSMDMIREGADILDIGGESTRPGADPVSVEEEINRTVPLIQAIRGQSHIPISIDTTKAEVARQAIAAGADIINDVSAMELDPAIAEVASESGAGLILMHMKGTPRTMQQDPNYENVVNDITAYLEQRIELAVEKGVRREAIMIDPGIGFGKTLEHNLDLLRAIPSFSALAPVLIGASRKSFIGSVLDRKDPSQRIAGSLGVAAWSILQGAHVLRVHDVIDTCDVRRVLDTLSTVNEYAVDRCL